MALAAAILFDAFMPLSNEEIARRMKAARQLRGMSQQELNDLFAEDGLEKNEAGRLERGDLALTANRRYALVRHLRVPERWFTSESVDEIVGYGETDRDRLAEELAELRKEVAKRPDIKTEIQKAFDDYASRLGPQIGRLPPRSRRKEDPPGPTRASGG